MVSVTWAMTVSHVGSIVLDVVYLIFTSGKLKRYEMFSIMLVRDHIIYEFLLQLVASMDFSIKCPLPETRLLSG